MPAYAKGRMAWGLCQRCGLRGLLRDLVLDGYYPNIRVCEGCYDPPQPQERLAVVSDPVALWKPAVDTYFVPPPVLTGVQVGSDVVLTWTSICGPPVGRDHVGGFGAYISAGYEVWRSPDGLATTYTKIATLLNTPDEFGAIAIETLTYTDVAPGLPAFYFIRGYDVNENAQNG